MIKINKKLVSTYVVLNNKTVDEYLIKLANSIKSAIVASSDNGDIFEGLDGFGEFVYKTPRQAVDVVRYVIEHPLKPALIETPMGSFAGKDHSAIAEKALELLDRIRYIYPDGVLPLLEEIILSGQKEQKDKAVKILERFTKYDFNILTKSKMGYGAQRKALDYVLAWPIEKRITNFDFVEIVMRELLGSSVEGTTTESMDTLTVHFGAVQPTGFLKKLRREVIDLVFDLYQHITEEQKKVRLARVLEEANQTPMNVAYGKDVEQMIAEDAQYLLTVYQRMLFDENGRLVGSIPVAEEIEKRLYWFHRSGKLNTPEAKKLRDDILTDQFYSLFRLFAGDDITFREEEGWDEAELKRSEAIDTKVEDVNEADLNDWITILNRVADQADLVARWQFSHFGIFLKRLATQKPNLALTILDDALNNDKPLETFAVSILEGLRDVKSFEFWDTVVRKIEEKRDPTLVSAVAYSLCLNRKDVDLSKDIREKDLSLLEDIVKCSGKFTFLTNDKENNWILQHAVINALIRNFARDSVRIETLILEFLRKHIERKEFLVRELEFGIIKDWIDYSKFSREGLDFLKSLLVDVRELDWHAQGLLLNLGKRDIQIIFDVFWNRIENDVMKGKKGGKKISGESERYGAIPFHFNDELKKYLSEHPQFQSYIEKWLEKVTPSWSLYSWGVSQFLKGMGNIFTNVLRTVIERGDKASLAKASLLMDRFAGGDIELCMEIVKRTTDKKIIGRIDSLLYSTGVVSGEFGIACAYEAKAEMLKEYLNNGSKRVQKYAERMIKNLEISAKKERQRTEEENQLRRIEFEG